MNTRPRCLTGDRVASDGRRAGCTHATEEKPSAGAGPPPRGPRTTRSALGQRGPHLLQHAAEQGGVAALPVHRHRLLALTRKNTRHVKTARSTASWPHALSRGVWTSRGLTGPRRMAQARTPASHEDLGPGCTGP